MNLSCRHTSARRLLALGSRSGAILSFPPFEAVAVVGGRRRSLRVEATHCVHARAGTAVIVVHLETDAIRTSQSCLQKIARSQQVQSRRVPVHGLQVHFKYRNEF